jgi:hypothetical protein
MQALFSGRCYTSRAGLLVTFPEASAFLNVLPNTFLHRFFVAGARLPALSHASISDG